MATAASKARAELRRAQASVDSSDPTSSRFGQSLVAGPRNLSTIAPPSASRTLDQLLVEDNFVISAMNQRPMNSSGGFLGGVLSQLTGVTGTAGGRNVPVNPRDADLGGVADVVVGTACGMIPNAAARAACIAAGGYVADRVLNRNAPPPTSTAVGRTITGQENCPAGYKKDANGVCRVDTLTGGYLPGDIGRPDTVWNPQVGLYGVGVTPVLVQSAKRACPPGFVLGKDGLCYESLGRTQRAHNPGARPLLTGGDVNALRRAKGLQKKIRRLGTQYGPKKPCSCGTRKKK